MNRWASSVAAGGRRRVASAATPGGVLFTRQAIGTGAAAGSIYTFAQQFAPGRVPSGQNVVCSIGGSMIRTQFEVQNTWTDGSAKMALMAIELPLIGNASTSPIDFLLGTHSSPGADLNMATALAGRGSVVTITPLSGGAFTYNLFTALPSNRVRSGPLVVETMHDVAIPSANFSGSTGGRIRLYHWVTKDGSHFVDVSVSNDAFAWVNGVGDLNIKAAYFSCAVTIDGSPVLSESVTSTGMAVGSGSSKRVFGRLAGGGAATYDPIFLRPAADEMAAAGVCAYYNQTRGVAASFLSDVQTDRASGGWNNWTSGGTATPLRKLINGNPSGNNENLYAVPFGDAGSAWMCGGHKDFYSYAMEQAEAMGASQHHYYDKTYGNWPSHYDRPGWFLDYRIDSAYPSPGDFGPDLGVSFLDDKAHHPLVLALPWYLRGRQAIFDSLLAYVHWESCIGEPTAPSGERIWGETTSRQVRTPGFTLSEFQAALFGLRSDHPDVHAGTLENSLDKQLQYWLDGRAGYEAKYGELYGCYDNYGGGVWKFWMMNMIVQGMALLAAQGNTKAATLLAWYCNMMVYSMNQPSSKPVIWTMAYEMWQGSGHGTPPGEPPVTGIYTTWAEFEGSIVAENPTLTPADVEVNVSRVCRQMLAMVAMSRPNDTQLQAACTAFDAVMAGGLSGCSSAEISANPKQNIRRPPGFAVQGT